MRRVLLVQPSLQPPGGGNGVAAWMLQALCGVHRVTVLSWTPVDVPPINQFFGTQLTPSSFDTIVLPRSWTAGVDATPLPLALVRSGLLMRYARRFSDGFDVLVGVHNEVDYGRRGIQYIHYPTYFRPRPAVDFRWYHRYPPLLNAYYRVADSLGDFSVARMKDNLTLTNSRWTAGRVREFLSIEAQVLYPPVTRTASSLSWADRQERFLAVGRISPEKEFERVIRILAAVRQTAPAITLTIVGTWDRKSEWYYDKLRALADAEGSWIQFRRHVSRAELIGLMTSCRYGIHGMREEHFGMAPAEMAANGMIVWVPAGGGQTEIVAGEPRLTFESDERAVEQISTVLASRAEQQRLRDHLAGASERFSTDRFVAEARTIVETFRE
jgi:glycosyltransferase involved in cell wall biosynthesis